MIDPDIHNRIFGGKQKGKAFTEDDVVKAHHVLMKNYGWIPLKEFEQLPLPTFWGLLEQCNEEEKGVYEWRKTLLKAHGCKIK